MLPSPITAFLISTKSPTFTPSARSAPGRRYANGPIFTSLPVLASSSTDCLMCTPLPTTESVISTLGPITQSSPMTVLPFSTQPGSSTVSAPIDTPFSTYVWAGSVTVTPSSINPRTMRSRISRSASDNATRSLTPMASAGSVVCQAATLCPSSCRIRITSVR
ncbi:hypothetical protein D3C75_989710 [compost metagenome]